MNVSVYSHAVTLYNGMRLGTVIPEQNIHLVSNKEILTNPQTPELIVI